MQSMRTLPSSEVVDEFYRQRPVDENGRVKVLRPSKQQGGSTSGNLTPDTSESERCS